MCVCVLCAEVAVCEVVHTQAVSADQTVPSGPGPLRQTILEHPSGQSESEYAQCTVRMYVCMYLCTYTYVSSMYHVYTYLHTYILLTAGWGASRRNGDQSPWQRAT